MPEVAHYKIGNTTVRIMDDACRKDPVEVEAILKRISRLARYARKQSKEQSQGEATNRSDHRS